ncbi:auxin-responsive protein IAA31-like [Juglans microcarpa x Juglans regia]|uniref:auxin-responsive protein IAA31-like n=1 Tax=Juglans microcarpa x Juglans regia TaxID=2249226 RepID=UPI001B7F5D42|nr:auxin-responsive protein IAA31-like [Juglans microcarpa x Juglans regia]
MDDLQLGLALIPVVKKVVTFDLNHDHRELQLLGSESWNYDTCLESQKCAKNKRNFEVAFGKTGDDQISCIINKKEEEENHVVGWPPIKPWVKKQLHHENQGGQIKINDRTAERSTDTGPNYSLYVKVKMEGVPIARKIDLRLYHSYQMLRDSLMTMFANYQQTEKDHGSSYTLTYQDKDGDWLLAGDVPWQSFMESVQRLEIIRNDG